MKVSLSGALKRRGEVAAWPSLEEESALDSDLRWRAVTPTLLVLQTLWRLQWLGSEAKSWCAFARALLLYPHCGAECAWRNTHANCHWLVLLTLEGDWALRRDPISQSLWRYVERDWLIGNIRSIACSAGLEDFFFFLPHSLCQQTQMINQERLIWLKHGGNGGKTRYKTN